MAGVVTYTFTCSSASLQALWQPKTLPTLVFNCCRHYMPLSAVDATHTFILDDSTVGSLAVMDFTCTSTHKFACANMYILSDGCRHHHLHFHRLADVIIDSLLVSDVTTHISCIQGYTYRRRVTHSSRTTLDHTSALHPC